MKNLPPNSDSFQIQWKTPEHDVFFKDHQDVLEAMCFRTWDVAIKHLSSFRTAIDIGAHIGTHSYVYSQFFDNVKAFEPLYFNECSDNIKHIENCEIYPYGISDASTIGHMVRSNNNSGISVVLNDDNRGKISKSKNIKMEKTYPVELRTLDEFGFTDVDFIKVDTEGYVYPILLGMKRTLEKWKPLLELEMNYLTVREQESLEFLSSLGYEKVATEDKDYFYK